MNFDRVAGIYDATRALPTRVVTAVVDRMVAATHAGPQARFLELGVGTGRIALPLIERGYSFTGVDVSQRMMERLKEKAGGARNLELIQTDATELPLPDASFDVVLTVHLLHLVPNWEAALREARRVLAPGGSFVMGNDRFLPGSPAQEIRKQWRRLVEETGATLRVERGTWDAVEAEVTRQGARTAIYRAAVWEEELVPVALLEALRGRTYSATWDVPEDVLEAVHQRMLSWARERFGALEQPRRTGLEFLLSVSRFPEPARPTPA